MNKAREVHFYTNHEGRCYIEEWINRIKKFDKKTAAKIVDRLVRLELGNYGDCKHIEDKIWELRLFFGKGYRIYYMEERGNILLLNGGSKATQEKDIRNIKKLLERKAKVEVKSDKRNKK